MAERPELDPCMTLPAHELSKPWWRLPSFVMLALLTLSLILYPFADSSRLFRVAAQLLDIGIVLMVVRAVRASGRWQGWGWMLSLPLMALQLAALLVDPRQVEAWLLGTQVLFHAYAVLALLSYVLSDSVITLDELFAIAASYILLALLWASAYGLLVHFDASAIYINEANNPDGVVSFAELVYFSTTTLTSVGFGEITPVTPAARAVVMLQQVFGVLFVAIVIARLTGLYGRHPLSRG